MEEMQKHQKFTLTFTAEIIDPVKAQAANMNWTMTEDGPSMMDSDGPVEEVAQALQQLLVTTLIERGPEIGVRVAGGGLQPSD